MSDDALQERVKGIAKANREGRQAKTAALLDRSLRREWYSINGNLVFFCPPLSLAEINEHFPHWRGAAIEPS